jgi:hypothetical protein
MTHEDFQVDSKYMELHAVKCFCIIKSEHAVKCFCIIKSEGDPNYFFMIALPEENLVAAEPEFVPQEIQDMVERGMLEPNDIYLAQNIVKTDDDNKPAPENLPQEGQGDPLSIFGEWGGHQAVCH